MVIRKEGKRRRGERTYHGSHKKWRGGGSRGGRGLAGYHKHKWSYVQRYDPEHFGKKGFTRPDAVARVIKAINLKDLDRMADKLVEKKLAVMENGKIKIDLRKIGYNKILGSGKITRPLIVEAKYFSKQAIEKVKEAGGEVIVKSG